MATLFQEVAPPFGDDAPAPVKRSAPSMGYDTPGKASYRVAVWSAFRQAVPDLQDDDNVLMMPSREGIEIEAAIGAGIPEDRIIAFDRCKRLIANSPWRKARPQVRAMTANAKEVGEALSWSPVHVRPCAIRIANLDLCATVSAETVETIKTFAATAPFPECGRLTIGITIARAREDSLIAMLLKGNKFPEVCSDPRMSALLNLCGFVGSDEWALRIHAEGKYISNKVPMGWVVITLERWRSFIFRVMEPLSQEMSRLNALCHPNTYRANRDKSTALAGEIADVLNREGLTHCCLPWHCRREDREMFSAWLGGVRASANRYLIEAMGEKRGRGGAAYSPPLFIPPHEGRQ